MELAENSERACPRRGSPQRGGRVLRPSFRVPRPPFRSQSTRLRRTGLSAVRAAQSVCQGNLCRVSSPRVRLGSRFCLRRLVFQAWKPARSQLHPSLNWPFGTGESTYALSIHVGGILAISVCSERTSFRKCPGLLGNPARNFADVQPFGFEVVNHDKFSHCYHMALPFMDFQNPTL